MLIEVSKAEKGLLEHALLRLTLSTKPFDQPMLEDAKRFGIRFTFLSKDMLHHQWEVYTHNLHQYQNFLPWRKVTMINLYVFLCSNYELYQMQIVFNLFGDKIGF